MGYENLITDLSLGLRVYDYIYGRCWHVDQRVLRFIVWSADWYAIEQCSSHLRNKLSWLNRQRKQRWLRFRIILENKLPKTSVILISMDQINWRYRPKTVGARLSKNGRVRLIGQRHIKIRYFWLKDRVDLKDVLVEYMPTEGMIADILTKPLRGDHYVGLKELTMNLS